MHMGEIDAGFFEYGTLLHHTRSPASAFLTRPLVFMEYVLLVDLFQCRTNAVLQSQQVAGNSVYVGCTHIASIRESAGMMLHLLAYSVTAQQITYGCRLAVAAQLTRKNIVNLCSEAKLNFEH